MVEEKNVMEKPDEVKAQSLSTAFTFVLAEAVKTVVGFVVLWFFRPVWERLVKWWTKK